MRVTISNQELFIKKALTLFIATIVLVPLIHFKLLIPAGIYISGLIFLHLFFIYLYFSKVPWKEIAKNKQALTLRIVGVAFLIYLLTILKFEEQSILLILNVLAAFLIHLLILLFMMVVKVQLRKNVTI